MSVRETLQSTFSRYELAILGGPPALVLVACGLWLANQGHRLPVLLVIGLAIVWAAFFVVVSLCPNCGKSPWLRPRGQRWTAFRRATRPWPERDCSGCGTPLDVI